MGAIHAGHEDMDAGRRRVRCGNILVLEEPAQNALCDLYGQAHWNVASSRIFRLAVENRSSSCIGFVSPHGLTEPASAVAGAGSSATPRCRCGGEHNQGGAGAAAPLGGGMLALGWRMSFAAPRRVLVVVYPHTKLGLSARHRCFASDWPIHWISKHSMFRGPLHRCLGWGGIPIDRSRPGGFIEGMVLFSRPVMIVRSPPRQRSHVNCWKSGFYRSRWPRRPAQPRNHTGQPVFRRRARPFALADLRSDAAIGLARARRHPAPGARPAHRNPSHRAAPLSLGHFQASCFACLRAGRSAAHVASAVLKGARHAWRPGDRVWHERQRRCARRMGAAGTRCRARGSSAP